MVELGPAPRLRIAIGAATVLVLVGLVAAVLAGMLGPRGELTELSVVGSPDAGTAAPELDEPGDLWAQEPLLVHIHGAVERPGVYRLTPGARVLDAIAAAGGLSDDAEPAGINLARTVNDAEQLRVPRLGETTSGEGHAADGRIDLNTADSAALETLPGVGPATAARILRWREEHGRFTVVEDLLAVSGIGPRTFEALRDLVTV